MTWLVNQEAISWAEFQHLGHPGDLRRRDEAGSSELDSLEPTNTLLQFANMELNGSSSRTRTSMPMNLLPKFGKCSSKPWSSAWTLRIPFLKSGKSRCYVRSRAAQAGTRRANITCLRFASDALAPDRPRLAAGGVRASRVWRCQLAEDKMQDKAHSLMCDL
jgi:hypothetical protein